MFLFHYNLPTDQKETSHKQRSTHEMSDFLTETAIGISTDSNGFTCIEPSAWDTIISEFGLDAFDCIRANFNTDTSCRSNDSAYDHRDCRRHCVFVYQVETASSGP